MGLFDIFKKKKVSDTKEKNEIVKRNLAGVSDISFGAFGVFPKEKIDVDYIFSELEYQNVEKEEQERIALRIFNEWKSIIESNSQYIVNYFMSRPFDTFGMNECWDKWWIVEKNKDEEEIERLRSEIERQILDELNLYLDKQNILDIKNLYKKYLPYFDYDKFLNGIKIEYLHLLVDSFSVQLSDVEMDFFCAAYESFDKDLNGRDWHNY